MIKIFTDGSCFGNPGPGGWAFVVPGVHQDRGGCAHTTANRMELTAIMKALTWLREGDLIGTIYSDSQWAIGFVYSKHKFTLAGSEIQWVRGHAGNQQNEQADRLARLAAEEARRDAEREP